MIIYEKVAGEIIKRKFKPKHGDYFYYINLNRELGYFGGDFNDCSDHDVRVVERGMARETEEEVVKLRDRLLKCLKEDV